MSQRRFHIFFCISTYGGSTETLVDGKLTYREYLSGRIGWLSLERFAVQINLEQRWTYLINFMTNQTCIILLIVNDMNIIYSNRVQRYLITQFAVWIKHDTCELVRIFNQTIMCPCTTYAQLATLWNKKWA